MTVILSRPFAISGFVISVVILAINGVLSAWTFAHVGEEIVKDQPSLADFDAAAAIPFKLDLLGVRASLLHFGPRQISDRDSGCVRWGVSVAGLRGSFALKASTTGCVSTRQIVADDDAFDAAIAETQETFIFGLGVREADDGQAAETLFRDRGSHV